MATKAKKPAKPRRDFPLFWHVGGGQWCKKSQGRFYYFGTDAAEAEKLYDANKERIRNGLPVDREALELHPNYTRLDGIVNEFLTDKRSKVDSSELTAYTFADCYRVCQSIVRFFGKTCNVASIKPTEFSRFRAEFAKTKKSPVSLANAIIRTRSFFNWAFLNKHIKAPVDYGTGFEIPNTKAKRRAKNEAKRTGQGRTFTAEECRKIIEAARRPLKAMVLLGLNCGLGSNDVANLPITAIDLAKGWIDFPRVKTETDRRCPLWPQTIAALKETISKRPKAAKAEDDYLAFLTAKGNRWIQVGTFAPDEAKAGEMYYRNDNVGKEFTKLLGELGLKRRGSFYNLRHTFRTAAANAKDRDATDAIMGHVDPTMGGNYIDHIEAHRLRAVTQHVHDWLFKAPTSEKQRPGSAVDEASDDDRPDVIPFPSIAG